MGGYRANEQDQKRAENIRRQYVSHEENKMEQLQKMDGKVKLPGRVAGTILGVTGALVMGAGMSLVMVSNKIKKGLVVSIPGMVMALSAYPVYSLITDRRKEKYAPEIMGMSEELINEQTAQENIK